MDPDRTFKAVPIKTPPCPSKGLRRQQEIDALKRQMANLQKMIETARPSQIGNKVVVKAVDETAKIVMEDYKMTDLKDNIRHGEGVAPKLPGKRWRTITSAGCVSGWN
jgi:hypothetical protein